MSDEQGTYIIKRLGQNFDFIRSNWKDAIAEQYIVFMQTNGQKLTSIEKTREQYKATLKEIEASCAKIEDECTGEYFVKIRKR